MKAVLRKVGQRSHGFPERLVITHVLREVRVELSEPGEIETRTKPICFAVYENLNQIFVKFFVIFVRPVFVIALVRVAICSVERNAARSLYPHTFQSFPFFFLCDNASNGKNALPG